MIGCQIERLRREAEFPGYDQPERLGENEREFVNFPRSELGLCAELHHTLCDPI